MEKIKFLRSNEHIDKNVRYTLVINNEYIIKGYAANINGTLEFFSASDDYEALWHVGLFDSDNSFECKIEGHAIEIWC